MAQRQIFKILNFSGGWNPDQDPTLIRDDQAQDIQNFRLDRLGTLVARDGWDHYVTGPLLDKVTIKGIGRWVNENDPSQFEVVVAANGNLYTVNTASDDYTSLITGGTDVRGEFTNVRDKLIFTNGFDVPVQFDGTTAQYLGLPAPLVAPTAVTGGAGGLTGTYTYVYTYFDSASGTESNPSDSVVFSPATQRVHISFTDSPDSRVDKIRIYRTTDDGVVFLRIAEVDTGASPYADNTITDGILAVETDNDPPAVADFAAFFQGYMFLAKEQTIYWSKPLDVEAWPVLNSTSVPFQGNDTIRSIYAFQDVLLVFGYHNLLVLTGSAGDWSITRLDVDVGAVSHRSVVEVEGSVIFLSRNGLWQFPQLQPFAPTLTRVLANQKLEDLQASAGAYVSEERGVWFTIAGNTYTIHLPTQSPSIYSIHSTVWLSGGENGFSKPLFLDPVIGRVSEYGGANNDNGVAMDLYWKSKIFQLTNPERVKHFRKIGTFTSRGAEAPITVTVSDGVHTHTVRITNVGSFVGGQYGSARYVDPGPPDPVGGSRYAIEGIGYFIGSLPAQTLVGHIFEVAISSHTNGQTEIVPPLTFEFRESNRFIGA